MAKGEKHNNVSSGLQITRINKQHIFSFIGGGNRNTRRKPQYNTILKVCVVIVSEGTEYTNIQNTKVSI
jgi:hypothetical protein